MSFEIKNFDTSVLKNIFKPKQNSSGEDNGQITIIGGSELFHGAPILSLKAASRIVDMVFFASPNDSIGKAAELIKSKLSSFIWIPWEETDKYIEKSDAVLIGPGFMRFKKEEDSEKHEHYDATYKNTREITKDFLQKFPEKKWVIDAGSLQTMKSEWIPKNAIITPNKKEFELLFGGKPESGSVQDNDSDLGSSVDPSAVQMLAKGHDCTIVLKGPNTIVCSPEECTLITNGNAGLTKGGTGDVLAGLTTALYAKNDAFLAAAAASYIAKAAADDLYKERSTYYNADDLASQIPVTLANLLS